MTVKPKQLRLDDRLFVDTAENRLDVACVNFGYPEVGYAGGYKMAADLAVKHVISTGYDQDYLVYPIIFCYRQHLELQLKYLSRSAARLLDEPPPTPGVMGRHSLSPLWRYLAPLMNRLFPEHADQFALTGERVDEFDSFDQSSFTFRYPTTKTGEQSLPNDLHNINLVHLSKVMALLSDELETLEVALNAYLDMKSEMKSI